MSLLHGRPMRWIAGGAAALVLTIYSALMLGLNVPSVRAVPLAPWAEGGFGADRHDDAAAVSPAGVLPDPNRVLSHVAGVRFPATRDDSRGAEPPASPDAPAPETPRSPAVPLPRIPPVPTLPALAIPTLPALNPTDG